MASFKMRAFGPWRQVKTLADVEDNPEFEGFGVLEVLESYEIVKVSFSPKKLLTNSNCHCQCLFLLL